MTLPCILSLKGSHLRSVVCMKFHHVGTRNIALARGFSSYAGALCDQRGEEYGFPLWREMLVHLEDMYGILKSQVQEVSHMCSISEVELYVSTRSR